MSDGSGKGCRMQKRRVTRCNFEISSTLHRKAIPSSEPEEQRIAHVGWKLLFSIQHEVVHNAHGCTSFSFFSFARHFYGTRSNDDSRFSLLWPEAGNVFLLLSFLFSFSCWRTRESLGGEFKIRIRFVIGFAWFVIWNGCVI